MAYSNDDGIHQCVKMLMALPYLPHQEIPASFQRLKLQATNPVLYELVDYVDNQWINTNITVLLGNHVMILEHVLYSR